MTATAPAPNNSIDLRQSKEANYYAVQGECGNCRWAGTLMVEVGQAAPEFGSSEVTCRCCVRDEVAKAGSGK